MENEKLKNELLKRFDEELVLKVLSANRYRRILFTHYSKYSNIEKIVDVPWCAKLYSEYNMPMYKIGMLYGVSDASIRNLFLKSNLNIKMKGHQIGKNSYNEYFKTIDTKDKAYFLGLMSADGSVVGSSISLELTECDQYILERFNKYANFHVDCLITEKKNGDNSKPRKTLRIHSKNMTIDLKKYGIIQNKSALDSIFIPNLSKKLISHFIRGYFDGDGIAYSDGKIGFCGSNKIVHQIHDFLVENYNMSNVTVTYNKSNHIYYCTWCALTSVYNFYKNIYKDCDDLFLIRKREKIEKRLKANNIEIY